MPTRAQLLAYADANFDDNNVGGIEGLELNTFSKDIANSAVIKNEAGDVAGGLSWVGGVLTIATNALAISQTSGLQTALDAKVAGPASVTAGLPAVFSGTTGKLIASVTFAAFKASLAIAAGDVSGLSAFATSTDLANASGTLAAARIADASLPVAKLVGGADNTLLRMNGTALMWGQLNNSMIADGQITKSKLTTGFQAEIDSYVAGPASSVSGQPAIFSDTTGKLIAETTFAAFKSSLAIADIDVRASYNAQSVDYTFGTVDMGGWVRHNSGTPHTYTVAPFHATTAPWTIGTRLGVMSVQGVITIAAGVGVTLRVGAGFPTTVTVPSGYNAMLVYIDTNVWQFVLNNMMPANSLMGNNTAGYQQAVALSAAQVKTLLAIGAADVSGLGPWATGTDLANASGFFDAGTAAAPSVAIGEANSGWFRKAAGNLGVSLLGVEAFDFSSSGATFLGTIRGGTNTQLGANAYSNDAFGGILAARHARGTVAVPANLIQNDLIGSFNALGWGDGGFRQGGAFRFQAIAATPSSTNMEARWLLEVPAAGSVTSTEGLRYDHATGFSVANKMLAQGYAFPATQVASADANTLDDYEEGTFTPGFTFATPATGITYAVQLGHYVKIGRWVFVYVRVTMSNKGTGGAGVMFLTGLPFASSATNIISSSPVRFTGITLTASTFGCFWLVGNSSVSASLQSQGNTGSGVDVTYAMLGAGTVDTIAGMFYQAGA